MMRHTDADADSDTVQIDKVYSETDVIERDNGIVSSLS